MFYKLLQDYKDLWKEINGKNAEQSNIGNTTSSLESAEQTQNQFMPTGIIKYRSPLDIKAVPYGVVRN